MFRSASSTIPVHVGPEADADGVERAPLPGPDEHIDGRVGSGAFVVDLETGEIIDETPHVGANFESIICPALGGAPASQ